MSKKLLTMFFLFVTVFLFTGADDLMGCHYRYATGLYRDSSSNVHAFLRTEEDDYNTTSWTSLDYPSATWTRGRGVNDSGHVVGEYLNSSSVNRGFKWNGSSYTDIMVANSTFTEVMDINNDGDIVGSYKDSNGDQHGFFYDGTDWTYLTYNDGTADRDTVCHGLNDNDEIVGTYIDSNGDRRAFYYDGSFTDITRSGADESSGWGINISDEIVGDYTNSSNEIYGFYYDGIDYTAIEVPNAAYTWATGINDAGIIVGYYEDSSGDKWGFEYDGSSYTYPIDYNSNSDQTRLFDISDWTQ